MSAFQRISIFALLLLVAWIALGGLLDWRQISLMNRSAVLEEESITLSSLRRYLSKGSETGSPLEGMGAAQGAIERVGRGRVSALFGSWWDLRPHLCLLDGCPCTTKLPCFRPCREDAQCENPGKGVDIPGKPLSPNALHVVAKQNLRSSRARKAIFSSSIAVSMPRAVVLAVDDYAGLSVLPGHQRHSVRERMYEVVRGVQDAFTGFKSLGDSLTIVQSHSGEVPKLPHNPDIASVRLPFETTELAAVISEAAKILLSDPATGQAERRIILLTSGLIMCDEHQIAPASECDRWRRERAQGGDELYRRHFAALRDVLEAAVPNLQQHQIALDVMLIGEIVEPHTVSYPSLSTEARGCMSEDEMTIRNYPQVAFDSFAIPERDIALRQFESVVSGVGAYRQPNAFLYRAAKATGGAWLPLRKGCAISKEIITGAIETICHGPRTPFYASMPVRIRLGEEAESVPYTVKVGELIEHGVMDAEGRLLCNPEGTAEDEQARDDMIQIFSARGVRKSGDASQNLASRR